MNHHSIYSLNKKRLHAYLESHEFPEKIKKIKKIKISSGLKKAKKNLNLRLNGKTGVDMYYSQKSAFHKNFTDNNIVSNSKKVNVLVATHCFFDSPHSYGFNLFPDFYEWLDYLGKLSNKKDYNWYIKLHPDYLPGTINILNNFKNKYKKFKIVDPEISHHQLIREGIDIALTVYGTIGMEYPLLDTLVINAQQIIHIIDTVSVKAQKNLSLYKNELSKLKKRKELNKKKRFMNFIILNI